MFRPSQFRIQAFGNAYVPQRKIFWWWKNLSVPVASMEAARKIILEHTHPRATRPGTAPEDQMTERVSPRSQRPR